ncbi:MAG TPA: APC family permease [Steroidobacteraceae bacterium]|nr:APC family permease [Steroidobacteraceae bacterium]
MSEAIPNLLESGLGSHRVASLRRTLSYQDLIIYGLAYVSPFGVLQSLGFVWQVSNGLIVLAYVLGTICMYFTAKSFALMTETVPSAGSVYGFARHALGPFAGFIAGWMILLDYLLMPAYVYVFMSVALGTLVPQIDRGIWILVLSGTTLGINWFGVRVSQRFNLVAVALQLVILAVLMLFSLHAIYHGRGNGGLTLRPLYAPELFHATSIFAATSLCVMSFLGFDAISTLSEEVKSGDRRLVGRAIVAVLFLSAALFAVLSWILGDLLSGFAIKDPAAAIYEVVDWAIGPWLSLTIAWAMATFVGLASALPIQVGVARVLFAMGRDRQLPAVLAKVHPKYGTPYVGMLATAAISIGVALAMRYHMDELTSIINFGALSGFLLLHVSVIALFWFKARSGRWIVHLLVPVAGIIVVLAVLSGMSSLAMMLGLSWLAVGLAYGTVLTKRRRAELTI